MRRLYYSLPCWVLTAVVSLAILYLTLVPRPLPDVDMPLFPGVDKLVHAIMFGGLSGTMVLDWSRWRGVALSARSLVVVALVSTLAGGLIELLQLVMAMGRGCELWDFVADGVGAFLGAWVARPVARWLIA
ncbi:MAG: VanZ family protein [Muribaculaceae bacterium]|nr:VanZ family protein [Muribaculaceae bacterium]